MGAEKMCRLCMGRSNLIHSVLDDNLLQKIAICVSIMINPSDTMLPLELCALCALKVKDFFEFRQNCLKVQQLLEQSSSSQNEEPISASQSTLEVKQEKQNKPSAEPVEIPHLTKFEIVDEDDNDENQDEIPEPEEISIIGTEMERSIEELEELPEEDELIDELVEQDDIIYEGESLPDVVEHEQESDTQTTDGKSIDYHIEMIEFNFDQNPLEDGDQEQSFQEEQISPAELIKPFKVEANFQKIEDTSSKSINAKNANKFKTRKKRCRPKAPRTNLSEKEIYQSLLQACETCGKSVERNRMEGHRNRHLDLRPYVCSVENCGMAFHSKISLRLHTKGRHGTEELHCDICGKFYSSKKALYHHKKEGHAEKQYACEECGLVFVSNARLNRHKVTHTDLREFKCPHCPKEFYRSNNLKVHIRSHTKEKPFGCPSCDKAFGYQRLLREHMKRHHKGSVCFGEES